MNIVKKALEEIKYAIPSQILSRVFLVQRDGWDFSQTLTLDTAIMDNVIYKKVMPDCSLMGGEPLMIPIGNLVDSYPDPYTRVVRIPPEARDYRDIMYVLSAHYLPNGHSPVSGAVMNGQFIGSAYGSESQMAAARVANSHGNLPILSTALIHLTGVNTNTVVIRDRTMAANVYSLRVQMANEANMANLLPRTFLTFAELCVLATKMYIYNEMILPMGGAYLEGGQELGIFKEVVDEYRDSRELYLEKLKTEWSVTNHLNNREAATRWVRQQINPGI